MLAISPYSDWRGYDAVSFVVASATDESVGIRVMLRADKKNYFHQFEASPEPRRVRINFDDVRAQRPDFYFPRVSSLFVRAAEPGKPYEVLLDDFRLEN